MAWTFSTYKLQAKNTPDAFKRVPDLFWRGPGPENRVQGVRTKFTVAPKYAPKQAQEVVAKLVGYSIVWAALGQKCACVCVCVNPISKLLFRQDSKNVFGYETDAKDATDKNTPENSTSPRPESNGRRSGPDPARNLGKMKFDFAYPDLSGGLSSPGQKWVFIAIAHSPVLDRSLWNPCRLFQIQLARDLR